MGHDRVLPNIEFSIYVDKSHQIGICVRHINGEYKVKVKENTVTDAIRLTYYTKDVENIITFIMFYTSHEKISIHCNIWLPQGLSPLLTMEITDNTYIEDNLRKMLKLITEVFVVKYDIQ